ncbi:UAA transporter [Ptychographa xylographoides]|nr:UAA transporter [Ptychographa xylographoides]
MENIVLFHRRREVDRVAVSVVDGSVNVPTSAKMKYLAIYFLFNLFLTLFNKALMTSLPFPYLMTAYHGLAVYSGTGYLLYKGHFRLSHLNENDAIYLYGFSLLYTVNIAVSNVSLSMVTVPFHQVVRATTPIFTIFIYRQFLGSSYSKSVYLSLAPVIFGVGLASYGDYYASFAGFVTTLLGAILAALKTVATNRLQTAGLHLHALELLYRMSLLAIPQALVLSYMCGELEIAVKAIITWQVDGVDMYSGRSLSYRQLFAYLLVNGFLAFGLNLISFTTNKKVGALTMTVAGNVKQILTVILAFIFWHLKVGLINAVGISLTLIGGVLYGYASIYSPVINAPVVDEESGLDDKEPGKE